MWPKENEVGDWAEIACRRVGRLAVALREARARGEVTSACEPEAVAHFLVASLEGAILVSRTTRDVSVVQQCVGELGRYLALYERATPSGHDGRSDDVERAESPS
jgi:Tetracyclin repressor-like, C-terminal domain